MKTAPSPLWVIILGKFWEAQKKTTAGHSSVFQARPYTVLESPLGAPGMLQLGQFPQ